MSAVLLLAASACSADPGPESGTNLDLEDWAETTLGGQLEAAAQSGFAATGKTDGGGVSGGDFTSFTGVEPGWYAVTIACAGSANLSVSIEASDGLISEGSTDCNMPPVAATVRVPSSEFRISVAETESEILWAIAAEPTEEPAPSKSS